MDNAEREKKKKYQHTCLNKCRNYTPFVALVDILLWVAAEATLECLASRLTTKWKDPYSRTCGYVKSRVVITLVRSTHSYIQGGKVPVTQISVTRPQWENRAGLHLFW